MSEDFRVLWSILSTIPNNFYKFQGTQTKTSAVGRFQCSLILSKSTRVNSKIGLSVSFTWKSFQEIKGL